MNQQKLGNMGSFRALTGTMIIMVIAVSIYLTSCSSSDSGKPNSNFKGVQIGVISYSWRSMPGEAEDILNYCIQSGISSIELMGNVAEQYAGIPPCHPDRVAESK